MGMWPLLYCLHILNVSFIGFIDLHALILYVLEKLYVCDIFFKKKYVIL